MLAKLAGHSSGLLVSVVLTPWVAVHALLSVAAGGPWPLARFAATVVLVGAFVVFHVALVLALSVVTGSRGAVLAIPLALLVGGDLVVRVAPWAADGMPFLLNRVAAGLLGTGEVLAWGPIVAAGAWTVVLTCLAVWRFDRQEL
ncbi:hypothetical protein BH20ACT3_BH20ACT3_00020 [soil metagenome]